MAHSNLNGARKRSWKFQVRSSISTKVSSLRRRFNKMSSRGIRNLVFSAGASLSLFTGATIYWANRIWQSLPFSVEVSKDSPTKPMILQKIPLGRLDRSTFFDGINFHLIKELEQEGVGTFDPTTGNLIPNKSLGSNWLKYNSQGEIEQSIPIDQNFLKILYSYGNTTFFMGEPLAGDNQGKMVLSKWQNGQLTSIYAIRHPETGNWLRIVPSFTVVDKTHGILAVFQASASFLESQDNGEIKPNKDFKFPPFLPVPEISDSKKYYIAKLTQDLSVEWFYPEAITRDPPIMQFDSLGNIFVSTDPLIKINQNGQIAAYVRGWTSLPQLTGWVLMKLDPMGKLQWQFKQEDHLNRIGQNLKPLDPFMGEQPYFPDTAEYLYLLNSDGKILFCKEGNLTGNQNFGMNWLPNGNLIWVSLNHFVEYDGKSGAKVWEKSFIKEGFFSANPELLPVWSTLSQDSEVEIQIAPKEDAVYFLGRRSGIVRLGLDTQFHWQMIPASRGDIARLRETHRVKDRFYFDLHNGLSHQYNVKELKYQYENLKIGDNGDLIFEYASGNQFPTISYLFRIGEENR